MCTLFPLCPAGQQRKENGEKDEPGRLDEIVRLPCVWRPTFNCYCNKPFDDFKTVARILRRSETERFALFPVSRFSIRNTNKPQAISLSEENVGKRFCNRRFWCNQDDDRSCFEWIYASLIRIRVGKRYKKKSESNAAYVSFHSKCKWRAGIFFLASSSSDCRPVWQRQRDKGIELALISFSSRTQHYGGDGFNATRSLPVGAVEGFSQSRDRTKYMVLGQNFFGAVIAKSRERWRSDTRRKERTWQGKERQNFSIVCVRAQFSQTVFHLGRCALARTAPHLIRLQFPERIVQQPRFPVGRELNW